MRQFVRFRASHAALGAAFVFSVACTDASLNDGDNDGPGTSGPIECSTDDSTWQGIQKVVFDGYGCTNGACHGGNDDPAGGLDLSPAVAYQNLVRVSTKANLSQPKELVFPGEQNLSFLFEKLAAATRGTALEEGAGDPMPLGTSALTEDHLEAVRLWIRAGAPETGIVEGTSGLLDCGLSNEFTANKVTPPPPPELGTGVQFVSGPWTVEGGTEDEVCFATYYDFDQMTEMVPPEFRFPCPGRLEGQECFAYNRSQLTQDAQSHHSIISAYFGDTPTSDPSWGEWKCNKGDFAGMACDPAQVTVSAASGGGDCGELAACASTVTSSFACAGWGPSDQRSNRVGMGGAQTPVSGSQLPQGVYSVLPVKGVIIWNSHAFNLTEEDTTVEQYNNFWFASAAERVHFRRSIFDAKDIFVANVPPFEQRTYCSSFTLPENANLMSLGSHAHKRGWLWQTWLPPNTPECTVRSGCEPRTDAEPDYVSRIYNDPVVTRYDPPLEFRDPDPTTRTLQFCVTYDNGKEDRSLVKRNSTSVGSTCIGDAFCYGGPNEGMPCGSDDSVCGEGGVCDACTVRGGGTTEDEMFILLGSYYVDG